MSINRWDPFRDMMTLREAMANLMEESYVAPRSIGNMISGGGGNLALDVHENANEYTITAAVPGVGPDDVDINVLGSTVRIHGEFKPQEAQGANTTDGVPTGQAQGAPGAQVNGRQSRWIVRERRYGTFDRVITLPTAVKAERGEAHFENGVLTLVLPKVEEAKPRAIKINTRAATAIDSTATDSTTSPTTHA